MNQKALYGILIAIVVVLLGLWMFKASSTEAPSDTSTTTPVGTTSNEVVGMKDTSTMKKSGENVAMVKGALTDGEYVLDLTKSDVAWEGSKTLVKTWIDKGNLDFSAGSVTVTNGNVVAGLFTVDMNTLSVTASGAGDGLDKLAGHLKSADFFDVVKYPTATIALKGVTNGTVTADVTIKGTTKTISFPATITKKNGELLAQATLTMDRTNWDIRYGSSKFFGDLGDKVIDDKVTLNLDLVAKKK